MPVKIQGASFWAYLDTGSGRNFISSDPIERLNLKPDHYETHQLITVNGGKKQSMPIYNLYIDSIDGQTRKQIRVSRLKMGDFTVIKRPDLSELKLKHDHTKDKQFYMRVDSEYPIEIILGDNTYYRMKTEELFIGKPGKPIAEGTTFGWVIHGGELSGSSCMYTKVVSDYEKLYSLDVLKVEDRGE